MLLKLIRFYAEYTRMSTPKGVITSAEFYLNPLFKTMYLKNKKTGFIRSFSFCTLGLKAFVDSVKKRLNGIISPNLQLTHQKLNSMDSL